jgi:hypothetical protein
MENSSYTTPIKEKTIKEKKQTTMNTHYKLIPTKEAIIQNNNSQYNSQVNDIKMIFAKRLKEDFKTNEQFELDTKIAMQISINENNSLNNDFNYENNNSNISNNNKTKCSSNNENNNKSLLNKKNLNKLSKGNIINIITYYIK